MGSSVAVGGWSWGSGSERLVRRPIRRRPFVRCCRVCTVMIFNGGIGRWFRRLKPRSSSLGACARRAAERDAPAAALRGGAVWDNRRPMNPSRKRRIRLVAALTAALLAASALAYTSFSAGSDERTAGQLLDGAVAGRTYTLAGTVAHGSVRREGDVLVFRVLDPHRPVSVRVRYTGIVPDPFREGRGVMVQVRRQGDAFVGEKDSMVTKCPSKFQVAPPTPTKSSPV
jgi:cytochrome c-type biogenesis protein CcmE